MDSDAGRPCREGVRFLRGHSAIRVQPPAMSGLMHIVRGRYGAATEGTASGCYSPAPSAIAAFTRSRIGVGSGSAPCSSAT